LYQPVQNATQRLLAASGLHCVVQLVQHADEPLVVIVQHGDADAQFFRPGHQWHWR
jgi:hypothetical protein